ncbi:MAG: hypothetical protein WAO62_02250, partial [Burkholderiaceae bacterium]
WTSPSTCPSMRITGASEETSPFSVVPKLMKLMDGLRSTAAGRNQFEKGSNQHTTTFMRI